MCVVFVNMRFANKMKSGIEIGVYHEEKFRKEFEKAIKEGHILGVPIKKSKRFRSAFTTEQVKYLEKEFRKYPYIGNARRKDVSTNLDLPERAVKIWFQNRRMKEKKGATSKEPDSDKSMELNNNISIARTMQSTNNNNSSLPLLPTSSSPKSAESKENILSESKQAYKNNFKELSSRDDAFFNLKKAMPTVIKDNITSTTSETTFDSLKNCKTEKSDDSNKNIPATDPSSNHHKVAYASHISLLSGEHQNVDYSFYASSPSAVPQDLSSKQVAQAQNTQSEQKTELNHTANESFYLKGYYTPPYIPPGNMIWKPFNVTPFMASTPIPSLTISSPRPTVPNPNMMKTNCSCDCHKPYVAPMLVQNNPNPNVQYVITAVPFQNPNSKF